MNISYFPGSGLFGEEIQHMCLRCPGIDIGFGIGPECLVVGDMPVDIEMGLGAGAVTCGVTFGNSSREALAAAGANYVIDSFDKLLSII